MDALIVKEYMQFQPVAIKAQAVLTDVIQVLAKQRVTGAPVIDDAGQVIGFVSEQDCLRSLLMTGYHCDNAEIVDNVMSKEVLSVTPEDSVVELARKMTDSKPKLYPVVDDNKLVGSIDRRQILVAIAESQIEGCKVW
jgi:CBS domain-containing protein